MKLLCRFHHLHYIEGKKELREAKRLAQRHTVNGRVRSQSQVFGLQLSDSAIYTLMVLNSPSPYGTGTTVSGDGELEDLRPPGL